MFGAGRPSSDRQIWRGDTERDRGQAAGAVDVRTELVRCSVASMCVLDPALRDTRHSERVPLHPRANGETKRASRSIAVADQRKLRTKNCVNDRLDAALLDARAPELCSNRREGHDAIPDPPAEHGAMEQHNSTLPPASRSASRLGISARSSFGKHDGELFDPAVV